MQTYRPQVRRRGRIFQVVGRYYGKRRMAGDEPSDAPTATTEEAMKVIEHLSRPHQRVGIISHKAVRKTFEEAFPDAVVQHYGDIRGTNSMIGCDGLIVVGAMSPPSDAVLKEAAMLNPGRLEPFRQNDAGEPIAPWAPRVRTYELTVDAQRMALEYYGGTTPTRLVGGYADPDLMIVHDQACRAEVTQAVHRTRIISQDSTVWLLSPVPLIDTPVDWIADDPPLMPERWLAGQYEREPPIPIWRWLNLLDWGIHDREAITYEDIAAGAGVSVAYARNERWLDKLVAAYPDLFRATSISTGKPGRPARGIMHCEP